MKKAVIAVALLTTAWLCSTKMTGAAFAWHHHQKMNSINQTHRCINPHHIRNMKCRVRIIASSRTCNSSANTSLPPAPPQTVPPRTINSIATAWTAMLLFGDSMVEQQPAADGSEGQLLAVRKELLWRQSHRQVQQWSPHHRYTMYEVSFDDSCTHYSWGFQVMKKLIVHASFRRLVIC